MLSRGQKSHFDAFGFVVVRQAFSEMEMKIITKAFDDILLHDRDGSPLNKTGQSVWAVVEKAPDLIRMVEDDRIFEAAKQILGPNFIWAGSEGNITSHKQHYWHADRPGEQEVKYPRLKAMVYLDKTSAKRGALRVIPGSHKLPFHTDLWPLQTNHDRQENPIPGLGINSTDVPSVSVESSPGDLVFFSQSLFHAVFNSFPNRRYIALKFAAEPSTHNEIGSLIKHSGYKSIFEPHPSFTSSKSLRIHSMIRPLQEATVRTLLKTLPQNL
jgi:hypothetical protein